MTSLSHTVWFSSQSTPVWTVPVVVQASYLMNGNDSILPGKCSSSVTIINAWEELPWQHLLHLPDVLYTLIAEGFFFFTGEMLHFQKLWSACLWEGNRLFNCPASFKTMHTAEHASIRCGWTLIASVYSTVAFPSRVCDCTTPTGWNWIQFH